MRDAVQFSSEKKQYESIECRYFSAKDFLKKSFEIEPSQITLDLILKRLAQDIYYQTHELPVGILINADSFMQEINQFKYYYERFNSKNKWEKQLEEWIDIAISWKEYSTKQDNFKNFEDFLIENNI